MKVLLIDVNCKHSSTGKIVYDLYTELNNSGQEAAICYGRGPLIKEKNIFKFGLDIETLFHAGMSRITGLMGFFSIISTVRLINFIKKFKPDVVHIHELHAYFVNYGPLINFLKKNNIKTIWTFHCEFMYTGKCGYTYECEKFKKECNNCPQIKEYPKSFFFDFSKFMFRFKKTLLSDFENLTIVTPSQWLANKVKQSFLSQKKVIIINNGIDVEEIFRSRDTSMLREKLSVGEKKVILACAPNIMDERKGGKHFIQIANKLKTENFLFIMIGINESEKISGSNLLTIVKTKNQIELSEYYSLADVFLILSKIENYPTTCLESVSCGTPVIGYDVGGVRETIPMNFGKVVEYGKIEEISPNLINEVLSIKKSIKDLDDYRYNNSKKRMLAEYSKLYLTKE